MRLVDDGSECDLSEMGGEVAIIVDAVDVGALLAWATLAIPEMAKLTETAHRYTPQQAEAAQKQLERHAALESFLELLHDGLDGGFDDEVKVGEA